MVILSRQSKIYLLLQIAAASMICLGLPLHAQKRERDKDDPRARAEYIDKLKGNTNGRAAGQMRREALEQRDAMIQAEGSRFRESAARGVQLSIASNPTTWTPIGPAPAFTNFPAGWDQFNSGRVTALALDPTDGTRQTIYLGAAQGGVWKTTNGGASWMPLTDSQASLAIGSLAVDSTGVIYAGTGEGNFSLDSYYGAGILKSTDSGASWTLLPNTAFNGGQTSLGVPSIGAMTIQPGTSGAGAVILAAVNGNPSGLYRSANGGASWSMAAGISSAATSVAFSPVAGQSNFAFAGVNRQGVFRSTDGGVNFSPINGGITLAGIERVSLAVVNKDVVYAAISVLSNGSLSGLYKTTNASAGSPIWTKLTISDFCTDQCWYDLTVAVNPQNSNIVYVGGSGYPNNNNIQCSANGGSTWVVANSNLIHADFHAMAFTSDGLNFYAGNDGGVYSTTQTNSCSSGTAWTNLNNNLQTMQFYHNFALHPTDINQTFAGAQDNGVQQYSNLLQWDEVTCGDGAGAVYDVQNPAQVYVNCQSIDLRDALSGFNTYQTNLATSDHSEFIAPLVGDSNGTNLYFGTYRVWKSSTGTASWTAISGDLTSGGSTTIDGVTAIAVAPSDNTTIYAGSFNGKIWKGSSTGSFTQINSGHNFDRINGIAINASDATNVCLAVAGFRVTSNQVFCSTNSGTSWNDSTGDLPNSPAQDIVMDPDIPGTYYLATDTGVYRTQNSGINWSPLATGLPNVAVFGLKLHRPSRTLRAATHGRGMWDLYVPFNVTGPGASLTPGSLNLGPQAVGTTGGATSLILTNNGTATTTISSVSSTNNTDFGIAGGTTCTNGWTLAPGASCFINVALHPTVIGSLNATITVISNALTGSPQGTQKTFLTGTGTVLATNDNFVNAKIIGATPYSDAVTTTTATIESSDPFPPNDLPSSDPNSACGIGQGDDTRNHSVWYAYTPGVNGTAAIDTAGSSYDTVLSVWNYRRGVFYFVACNDDVVTGVQRQAKIPSINVLAGVPYYIMASGYSSGDSGTLHFTLTGPTPFVQTPVLTLSFARPGRPTRTSQPPIIASGQAARLSVVLNSSGMTGQQIQLDCTAADVICSVPTSVTADDKDGIAFTVEVRLAPVQGGSFPRRSKRLRLRRARRGQIFVNATVGQYHAHLNLDVQVD